MVARPTNPLRQLHELEAIGTRVFRWRVKYHKPRLVIYACNIKSCPGFSPIHRELNLFDL